ALMPMDVLDEGFRYAGRCERLEEPWLRYCRDTGDAATERIAGLSWLKTSYAGKTKVTDRSLEILGRMPSLEKIEFWECAGITNAGVALLAGLPRLIAITVGGSLNVTRKGMAVFPPRRSRELLVIAGDCGIVAPKIDVVGYSYISPKFIGND